MTADLDAEFYIRARGGRRPEDVIVDFVNEKGITQIVMGQSAHSRLEEVPHDMQVLRAPLPCAYPIRFSGFRQMVAIRSGATA